MKDIKNNITIEALNYDFDIVNTEENSTMDVLFLLNIFCFFFSLLNVRKILKSDNVEYFKNGKFLALNYFLTGIIVSKTNKKQYKRAFLYLARIIYESNTIYFHILHQNYNYVFYFFFQYISVFLLNSLLVFISITWYRFYF